MARSRPVAYAGGVQQELTIVNLQSEVTSPFVAAVAAYLTEHASLPVRCLDGGHWTDRRDAFLAGEVDLALLCGLPYALEADRPAPRCVLVAAPVMAAARYKDAPIYFSDVVVRRDAPWRSVEALRGASWAFNEPASHSGYCLTRYALAAAGVGPGFFGRVVESGAHMASMALVRGGAIDATAIDSTVLELAAAQDPSVLTDLRVIDTWGPSPAPPLLASRRVPLAVRRALTEALLGMADHPEGRAALAAGQVGRFAAVTDRDYDPIRRMAAIAAGYRL